MQYADDLRGTRMQAVIDRIDIGTAGTLEICTAAYASVLAIFTLQEPSFTRVDAVITLAGTPLTDPSANNTGTAAVARIKASNGDVVINNLTVGQYSGDVLIQNLEITATQEVEIVGGTITHAA